MFTGIVEERARVAARRESDPGLVLEVAAVKTLPGLRVGDSIAVNGVCLTAEKVSPESFTAEVVPETISRTNLGELAIGQYVNLERPMRADSRWEGHIVQGHVDATAPVVSIKQDEEGLRMKVLISGRLAPYLVEKGSIALDGVSLTAVSATDEGENVLVEVALVPHTLRTTVLGDRLIDDSVNVEVDILAKYVARYMERSGAGAGRGGAGP